MSQAELEKILQKTKYIEYEKCHALQYLFANLKKEDFQYVANYYKHSLYFQDLIYLKEKCDIEKLDYQEVINNKLKWSIKNALNKIEYKIKSYCENIKVYNKDCEYNLYNLLYSSFLPYDVKNQEKTINA